MKIAGKTLSFKGEYLEYVFECEVCKAKSIFVNTIKLCEENHRKIKEHHEEEAIVGMI